MSTKNIQLVKELYDRFNSRDIDGVLKALANDVAWANALDGGHVYGHEGVREYWTRQWAMVSPYVEPVVFQQPEDGVVAVEVIQTIFDLNGQPLVEQTHGLKDKTVMHIFRITDNKVTRFDVQG